MIDDNESEDSDDDDALSEPKESIEYTEAELNEFRKQVNDEVEKSQLQKHQAKLNNESIQKFIDSIPIAQAEAISVENYNNVPKGLDSVPTIDDDDQFEDAIDSTTGNQNKLSDAESIKSANLNDSSEAEADDDQLGDLDPNSREYRFKMVQKILDDARTVRSYSTNASTIAPSVIKDRIKKTIDIKEKKEARKKCVAKGEASAVTRIRKENRDTCKEYAGWDF